MVWGLFTLCISNFLQYVALYPNGWIESLNVDVVLHVYVPMGFIVSLHMHLKNGAYFPSPIWCYWTCVFIFLLSSLYTFFLIDSIFAPGFNCHLYTDICSFFFFFFYEYTFYLSMPINHSLDPHSKPKHFYIFFTSKWHLHVHTYLSFLWSAWLSSFSGILNLHCSLILPREFYIILKLNSTAKILI